MKKLILGLIIGFLLGSVGIGYAQMQIKANAYPIHVDGVKKDIQAYNIDGYTYLKLADVGKILGVNVAFNEVESRIEIQNGGKKVMLDPDSPYLKTTPDGIRVGDVKDGVWYIDAGRAVPKALQKRGYDLKLNRDTRKYSLVKGEKVIIEDVPIENGDIEYNYYCNTIIPLTQ